MLIIIPKTSPSERDKIANLREWRQKTTPLVNMKAIEQCPHGKECPRPGIPV